jgi:hypothetical protein
MSGIVDGRPIFARYGEHFCLTRQDPYRLLVRKKLDCRDMCGFAPLQKPPVIIVGV